MKIIYFTVAVFTSYLLWIVCVVEIDRASYSSTKYARADTVYTGCPCNNHDYQIELLMDTVWIYDCNKLIARYTSNWKNQMDTFLILDNQ